MDTQLVGAAGFRSETQQEAASLIRLQDLVGRHGPLAFFEIHPLTRSVRKIGKHRQLDESAVTLFQCKVFRCVNAGQIGLQDLSFFELASQCRLRRFRSCKDHESGRVHIQSVDGIYFRSTVRRTGIEGVLSSLKQAQQGFAAAVLPRNAQQARGFVDHKQVLILEDYRVWLRRLLPGEFLDIQSLEHKRQYESAFRAAGRIEATFQPN